MGERGKVRQAPPRGRHSPGAAAWVGMPASATDTATPTSAGTITATKSSAKASPAFLMVLAGLAASVAGWVEPLVSRLVYAIRVAAVASLGVGEFLRQRLGTALVVGGAVISLGVGVVLGGAGSSVSASLPGTSSVSANHGAGSNMKDWGELRPVSSASGTTGSASGPSQAPDRKGSQCVVGGPLTALLAGSNSAGPLAPSNSPSPTPSHSQPPSTLAPAGNSTTTSTSPTTTTRPPTTTTTQPPTTTTRPPTTTTQPPPTTTTPTTQTP